MSEKDSIIQEALNQGLDISNAGKLATFLACVGIGILTKPLPIAVMECAHHLQ